MILILASCVLFGLGLLLALRTQSLTHVVLSAALLGLSLVSLGRLLFPATPYANYEGGRPGFFYKYSGVIRFTALGGQGKMGCGGSVINSTTAITAAHCVLEEIPIGDSGVFISERVNIEVFSDKNEPVKTVGAHSIPLGLPGQLDLAVLKGDFAEFAPVKADFGASAVHGDELLGCGFPGKVTPHCEQLVYSYQDMGMWVVTGTLIPGMSGGPVFNAAGEVVAVNTAVSLAVPLSYVTPLIIRGQ